MSSHITRDNVSIFHGDVLNFYDDWPSPVVIISDGAYGLSHWLGDPSGVDELYEWYEPHIKKWSEKATPLTTLWFWNREIGWANIHPLLAKYGWEFVNCHIWDKGIEHVAGNKNYPDIVFSREIAELFETDHHEIILSHSEFEEFKREYDKIRHYNFKGDINVYILCSIASEYSKVIVTGDGGDECFGGYWLHQHPLGHRETGQITCFEDIHPEVQKYLKQMNQLGFRNFHYKTKSATIDYDVVWEYFVEILLPRHLEPLLHTAKILGINVYTPLFSKNLVNFMRILPYKERTNRKIEKDLASKYLPESIIERKSIGFDVALEKEQVVN